MQTTVALGTFLEVHGILPTKHTLHHRGDGEIAGENYDLHPFQSVVCKQLVTYQLRCKRHVSLDMCSTCKYYIHMAKMIQLRHVPDALHRQLKARAALAGMSLSDYLVQEVRKVAERPTLDEIKARLAALGPTRLRTSPTAMIREERDRR
jgi:plasmid stability protein